MAIDNIPNLAWLKTAPPLQKGRAAAVGKWHSACLEVRIYGSKVDGEKTLPPAGKLCNPCLRASRRPHGRGKTVTVAKGWGLVAKQEDGVDDITKQPYAKWLEESIATIAGLDPCCICLAATKADGTVFTGYYNADAADKAVFAHNIQSDIVMDIIKANADTISGILEDGK
jgi:hypothetical protein|nr:MAG TPA: hypothetical protein [Caudoviricetes sp.]